MSNQNNFPLQYRYNIKQASNGNKEKYQLGGLVDPIPNSPKWHRKNCMVIIVYSKENF